MGAVPILEHLSQVHSLNVSSTSLPPTTMSNPGPSTSCGSDPGPSTSGDGNPKKPSYFSLSQKTLPELKNMCKDAKLPGTGNKSQLMSSLIWGFKPNYESLGNLNVAEMKKMCADATSLRRAPKISSWPASSMEGL